MKLTIQIVQIFIVLFLTLSLSSCDNSIANPSISSEELKSIDTPRPGFIHTVFFWMKEDISLEDKKRFESELKKLEGVPTIQSVYWGPPAATSRGVIDNSYDYAWVVHFANAADEKVYQGHQIHLDFIKSCESLWEKVVVYDNLVKN